MKKMLEAIVKDNKMALPKEIQFSSKRAKVIKIGEMLLIKPIRQESLRGVVSDKFNKSAIEMVRELREEVDKRK